MPSRLELKIPPPVVALVVAMFMWLLKRALEPMLDVPWAVRLGSALVLGLVGIGTSAAGVLHFRRAGTTIDPMRPDAASVLVSAGVYRFTRNPMYLGMLLVLLGWAVYLSSLPAMVLLPAFVLYLNRFQIAPEERALAARFGDAYEDYRRRVRRWL